MQGADAHRSHDLWLHSCWVQDDRSLADWDSGDNSYVCGVGRHQSIILIHYVLAIAAASLVLRKPMQKRRDGRRTRIDEEQESASATRVNIKPESQPSSGMQVILKSPKSPTPRLSPSAPSPSTQPVRYTFPAKYKILACTPAVVSPLPV